MVLFLNYLPYLIIALGLFLCYRASVKHKGTDKVGKRIVLWLALTIVALIALRAVSNGYLGKAVGAKLETPTVEELATEAEEAAPIKDVLRKPDRTAEESDKHFAALTDWRADKAARENPPKPEPEATTETQELPLPAKQ
ncbi:predicted ORF [Xanthomonas phage XacN1]|nr:predicted ORF [Xanthomonas phage XacN1]BBA65688.1 predicted ORF [Xanthomonas phage XacN1]